LFSIVQQNFRAFVTSASVAGPEREAPLSACAAELSAPIFEIKVKTSDVVFNCWAGVQVAETPVGKEVI
jgi:hypothetical protein